MPHSVMSPHTQQVHTGTCLFDTYPHLRVYTYIYDYNNLLTRTVVLLRPIGVPFGNHFQWFTLWVAHPSLVCDFRPSNLDTAIFMVAHPYLEWAHPSQQNSILHPSVPSFHISSVRFRNNSLVTRSISSIYRFIVMLVADITDVR